MIRASKKELERFGKRLNEIMEEKGVSASELAKKLGISRQAVDNYRNAVSDPPISKLLKIADIFCVSVDWLLGRDGAAKSTDASLAAAVKYTGLSEAACRTLSEYAGVSSTSDVRKIILLSMRGYRSDVDPETLDSARILDCSCWVDTLSYLIENDELFTAFLSQVYGYKKSLDEAVDAVKETSKKFGGVSDEVPTFDEVRNSYEPAYRKARLAYFEAQDAVQRLIDSYAKAGEEEYKKSLDELLNMGSEPDGEHPETDN